MVYGDKLRHPSFEHHQQIAVVPVQVDNPDIQDSDALDGRSGKHCVPVVLRGALRVHELLEGSALPGDLVVGIHEGRMLGMHQSCWRNSSKLLVVQQVCGYLPRRLLGAQDASPKAWCVLLASVASRIVWRKCLLILGLEHCPRLLRGGSSEQIRRSSAIFGQHRLDTVHHRIADFIDQVNQLCQSRNGLIYVHGDIVGLQLPRIHNHKLDLRRTEPISGAMYVSLHVVPAAELDAFMQQPDVLL
mmetsp:Transcript_128415/g.304787  ORF Transcript_128415/g.304787 Transcript_128415/m.304787 type:complete len:245 (+) Transcript_128415:50-784(+)